MSPSAHPLEEILDRFPSPPLPTCEARAWLRSLPLKMPPEEVWKTCPDGCWMLEFCGRIRIDPRLLTLVACAIAETALPHWERRHPGDRRPHEVIELARAWTHDDAPIVQVHVAQHFAYETAISVHFGLRVPEIVGPKSAKGTADLVRSIVPWSEIERRLPGPRLRGKDSEAIKVGAP